MALSVGLNSVMRALLAQQQALDVASHNVANVNTPGYSRQRLRLASVSASNPSQPGLPGNGVQVIGTERIRNIFIDFQRRGQEQAAGYYAVKTDSLKLVETSLGEPGESGLRQVMNDFFNAWRDVANDPEQSAMRSAVVQAGTSLGFTATRIDGQLRSMRDDANRRVAATVTEINGLADQIASINSQIISLRGIGDPAGDLTDRRDHSIDRLSRLVDVQYTETASGSMTVSIGGRSLVSGSNVRGLTTATNAANNNYLDVQWASDGATLSTATGELGGLINQRDVDLPQRLADFNAVVTQLMADVNTAHAAGFARDGVTTGTAFFTGSDASDIAVNAAVAGNIDLVGAASVAGAAGDGSNALGLADLQWAKTMGGATQSYDEFYNSLVTSLGVDAKNAQTLADAQSLSVQQLDQLQQSEAGVNLDEEMVNIVQFQRAYQAAARVITVIDDMLDTLINRTI